MAQLNQRAEFGIDGVVSNHWIRVYYNSIMIGKLLFGIRINPNGQPLCVTIGTVNFKEAQIIDPVGILAQSGGQTAESKSAMSEYIRNRKNGYNKFTYNP
ncbi:hypothetical protein [Paenibacillus sp. EPM92]|uniref:hypothetical protein n=2 Tax=Paenibacillus TaxID=44249 RepID=UPI0019165A18|nr:hypothetical protein [Paenibacillus sp. EPM92]